MTASEVGYQPVGMKPLTWLRSRSAMSMTATQLLSALATKSVWPSGVTATASGVLPSGERGKRAVKIVSVTTPRFASITETQLLDAQVDEQPIVLRVLHDLVRMFADGDPGDDAHSLGLDDDDLPAGPVGNVEQPVAGQEHVVRPAADGQLARALGRLVALEASSKP